MAAEPNRAPGRKLVVESKGAPKRTILASSKGVSQAIKVSMLGFISFYLLQHSLQEGREAECAGVEPDGVIVGFQVQGQPLVPVEVVDGVIFLAGKAKQPVPGGVGGDVGLVHPADEIGRASWRDRAERWVGSGGWRTRGTRA